MNKVQGLGELAYKSLFDSIVSGITGYFNFLDSTDSDDGSPRPKKIKLDSVFVVTEVKEILREVLVGTYSPIRQRMFEEYRAYGNNGEHILFFLSCILDSSFISLKKVPVPVSSSVPTAADCENYFVKLMNIITKQCPLLKTLTLEGNLKFCSTREMEKLHTETFFSLKQLTQLKLTWIVSDDCIGFFSSLGSSCPNLTKLKLGDNLNQFPFGHRQQLALFLGSRADLISNSVLNEDTWKSNGTICHFQFEKQHVSPLCETLEHFSIANVQEVFRSYWVASQIASYFQNHLITVVFFLRHFPQLQKMKGFFSYHHGFLRSSHTIEFVHQAACNFQESDQIRNTVWRADGLDCLTYYTCAPPPSNVLFILNYFISSSLFLISFYCILLCILYRNLKLGSVEGICRMLQRAEWEDNKCCRLNVPQFKVHHIYRRSYVTNTGCSVASRTATDFVNQLSTGSLLKI
jgi:hypothetical protein